jgi:hypothetical protein
MLGFRANDHFEVSFNAKLLKAIRHGITTFNESESSTLNITLFKSTFN